MMGRVQIALLLCKKKIHPRHKAKAILVVD